MTRASAGPSDAARRPPWLIVQHTPADGPGLVAEVLRARRRRYLVRRVDRGDALPAVEDVTGVVVLGGPMGVSQVRRYPFLRRELRLLEKAAAAERPVLGICLGAQLLAAALGGRVYAAKVPEFGLGPVTLLAAGRRDPVLAAGLPGAPDGTAVGKAEVPVFHWHEDSYERPPGAVRLARTTHCTDQAFRLGERIYGVQFHPELDVNRSADWEVAAHGAVVSTRAVRRELERAGRRLIGAYFDEVEGWIDGAAAGGVKPA